MTESDWLLCRDSQRMLEFIAGRATERKSRLFIVACCRAVLDRVSPATAREAIGIAERYADGEAGAAELARGRDLCVAAIPIAVRGLCLAEALDGAEICIGASASDRVTQAAIIRDIFGNPFRPVVLSPGELVPTIVEIAKSSYLAGEFSQLPLIGDALENAGCRDTQILNHCRTSDSHYRGCWLVDLLLGRT